MSHKVIYLKSFKALVLEVFKITDSKNNLLAAMKQKLQHSLPWSCNVILKMKFLNFLAS